MNGWRFSGRGAPEAVLAALPLLLAGCASTVVQENLAETNAFAAREIGMEIQLQSTSDARATAASVARGRASSVFAASTVLHSGPPPPPAASPCWIPLA